MSGGHFNYLQYQLLDLIEELENSIEEVNKEFSKKTIREMKKGVGILDKAYIYVQRIDWLLSGDDGEDNFHIRLEENLKELKELKGNDNN